MKTQLLLDAMAEASGVGVSQEEFTERIIFNAQRFGVAPDEYFKRIQEQNQLGAVFAEVRRAKALADAVSRATVTDASGNVLDVAALFGFEPVAEESGDVDAVDTDAVSSEAPELDDSDENIEIIDAVSETEAAVDTVDTVDTDATAADGRRRRRGQALFFLTWRRCGHADSEHRPGRRRSRAPA